MDDLSQFRLFLRMTGSVLLRRILLIVYLVCFYGGLLFLALLPGRMPDGAAIQTRLTDCLFPWGFVVHGAVLRILYPGGMRFFTVLHLTAAVCCSAAALYRVPDALMLWLTDALLPILLSACMMLAGMLIIIGLRTLAVFLLALRRS